MTARKPLNRREFLKMVALAGGLSALSPVLDACTPRDMAGLDTEMPPTQGASTPTAAAHTGTPTQAAAPTASVTAPSLSKPTTGTDTARIAFVKTSNRAEGVRKAIDLFGQNPVRGKSVFIKPNFNSADPAPGSTHPDVLRSLVQRLQEMGAGSISMGDRSGMGNTRRVMEQIGVFELGKELGFKPVVFDELDAEGWEMVTSRDFHWKEGFPFARPCLEAEVLVQACCLKTHQYGGHFTMSLKNSVGMVAKRIPGQGYNFMGELHNSQHQRTMIAEINLAYRPALIVLDGVEAFISRGPARGERVSAQVMLAGTDRVAIDAVGVALLRYFGTQTKVAQGPVFQQDQIKHAVQLGLGVDSPEKIELVTPDAQSASFAASIQDILLKS